MPPKRKLYLTTHSPTPTTISFTVSTRPPNPSRRTKVLHALAHLLRILLVLLVVSVVWCKLQSRPFFGTGLHVNGLAARPIGEASTVNDGVHSGVNHPTATRTTVGGPSVTISLQDAPREDIGPGSLHRNGSQLARMGAESNGLCRQAEAWIPDLGEVYEWWIILGVGISLIWACLRRGYTGLSISSCLNLFHVGTRRRLTEQTRWLAVFALPLHPSHTSGLSDPSSQSPSRISSSLYIWPRTIENRTKLPEQGQTTNRPLNPPTEETLLTLTSLGLQTSSTTAFYNPLSIFSRLFGGSPYTSSIPTLLASSPFHKSSPSATATETRISTSAKPTFIPTSDILDLVIHEAFTGLEVRFYLAVIVRGRGEVAVVFPVRHFTFKFPLSLPHNTSFIPHQERSSFGRQKGIFVNSSGQSPKIFRSPKDLKSQKQSTAGIRWWSPTQLLTSRHEA